MATDDLIMIDNEEVPSDKSGEIVIMLHDYKQLNNMLIIPRKDALRLATNIIVQVDLINGT